MATLRRIVVDPPVTGAVRQRSPRRQGLTFIANTLPAWHGLRE